MTLGGRDSNESRQDGRFIDQREHEIAHSILIDVDRLDECWKAIKGSLANRARPLMSHVAAAGAISDGGTDENSKYS